MIGEGSLIDIEEINIYTIEIVTKKVKLRLIRKL